MNQIVNVTQEETIILEYTYDDKIKVPTKQRNQKDKFGRTVKKEVDVDVDKSERRRGIGGKLFEKDPNFKFPIIKLTRSEAERILRSEKKAGRNNFRMAVPLKKG